jgi:hypothetical protein
VIKKASRERKTRRDYSRVAFASMTVRSRFIRSAIRQVICHLFCY